MKLIFGAHMPAVVHEVDDRLTGLSLFMLAAVGPRSDLESIYQLLKEFPVLSIGSIDT